MTCCFDACRDHKISSRFPLQKWFSLRENSAQFSASRAIRGRSTWHLIQLESLLIAIGSTTKCVQKDDCCYPPHLSES
jgi:hypothetical protein